MILRSKSNFLFFCLVLASLILLSMNSCGPARHLPKGELLLSKVKIKSEGSKLNKSKLQEYLKQEPNRQLLGLFKIYLGIYNLYYNKPESRIRERLGEPPVVYDSSLTARSAEQLHLYLNNRGFYDNTVSYKVKKTKKKAKVSYSIKKGKIYKINSIGHQIQAPNISPYFYADTARSLIKKGFDFSTEILQNERERISRNLKNNGFYYFSKEYIYFEADTSETSKSADLTLIIKKYEKKNYESDSIEIRPHQQYHLNNIFVRLDYDMNLFYQASGDTVEVDGIYFISSKQERKFNQKALARVITLRKGDLYQIKNQELSYRNLAGLRTFKYISIRFEESIKDGFLDVFVELSPRKFKSFTIQTETTNSGGNLGINGSFVYQNNNTFKGAEILSIGLNGGLEAQQTLDEVEDEEVLNGKLPFNTFEFGPEISLEVPRFLIPFKADRYSMKGNPKTHFNASYNYQERPDYKREVSKIFMAYSWNESPTKTHIVHPFDFSFINLDPSPEFRTVLENIDNPFIRNSYQDNLIMAIRYSFIFNNQTTNPLLDSWFFRANAESAGNFLSLINSERAENRNLDGTYNVWGIRYAQYVRTDLDLRFYQNHQYSSMVYRFAGGIGLPYGNSKALPFEKSFFAGGANGIRAWKARELGPGSLSDEEANEIDQIGNMNLEINLEYRFDITNVIEGALFMDGGNIWEFNQSDPREDTNFELDKLWNDVAIGVGTGIRLDFNFFMVRFDLAAPIKDPSNVDPKAFDLKLRESNLNIGIGYPF